METLATDLDVKTSMEAQARFIKWVMKEENTDWNTAFCMCTEGSGLEQPEYTLGYKLANPVLNLAMFVQPSKKKRSNAIDNFKETLNDRELYLFETEVLPRKVGKVFMDQLKSKKA